MKVCLVAESYPPSIGGIAIATQKLAEGLAEVGTTCVVITTRSKLQTPRLEERGNLKVVRVLVPPFLFRWWFTVLALPSVFRYGRKCDIIQGSTYGGTLPSLFASVIMRKRRVLLVHEFLGELWRTLEPNWLRARFYQMAEKLTVFLPFEKFVAVSQYTKSTLRRSGVPDEKINVIYLGDGTGLASPKRDNQTVRNELSLSNDDFVFLTYGRTGITKGIEYFVQALPLILNSVPSARFILILTKYDRRIWRRILKGLNKVSRSYYRLLPSLSREYLSELLRAADCIVVPSLSEGFGLTAVEACSLGKRVVATSAGALPEVVFGEHVLVEPGSAEALAAGCAMAFKGECQFREPRNFSWKEAVSKYKALYEALL